MGLDPDDPESVVIRFIDENGIDLDEGSQRKIERGLAREDFRNVLASEIGEIGFPARNSEFYTQSLVEQSEVARIRERDFKLVIDYGFGVSSHILPSVLSKLGGDILGINPFSSTKRMVEADPSVNLARLGELVVTSRSELGFSIDPVGERIQVVDGRGRALSGFESQVLYCRLVAEANHHAQIALPVGSPRASLRAIERFGGEVFLSKRGTVGLNEAAFPSSGTRDLAAGLDGSFTFPGFLPGSDACAALVQLLSLLVITEHKLTEVVNEIEPISIVEDSVVTPWESKGMVMRILLETLSDSDPVLIDGIYVSRADGWYLIVPDPVEPLTNIWMEFSEPAVADELMNDIKRRIKEIVSSASSRITSE